MIVHTITLGLHIMYRSFQAFGPVARAFEYFLPSVTNYRGARIMSTKTKTVNSKHLKKGDPLPPWNGVLRVYNMRYCPYAQRTILVLNAKNIDYEVVNVNLADKPEWLAAKSPFTKVPAIEISDGVTIYESLVTAEYLDDVYKEPRLQSDDPLTRARDKIIIEHCSAVQALMFRTIKLPETVTPEHISSFHQALDHFQSELVSRGGRFLHGGRPGYVDYMIWPWLERLMVMKTAPGQYWPLPTKYARLTEYIEELKKDPAISQYLIPEDIFLKFFQSYRENNPQYHFLDQE